MELEYAAGCHDKDAGTAPGQNRIALGRGAEVKRNEDYNPPWLKSIV